MGDELLTRAGLGGRPTGSFLPTADEVWLKLKNLISGDDAAVVASARSADQMLLDSVEQFLQNTPTAPAAAAARWLMEELRRDVGPSEERNSAPKKQPG